MLPSDLLQILVCPVCKSELRYNRVRNILICEKCGTYYPVNNGIPDLRPEAARKLEDLIESEKNNNN